MGVGVSISVVVVLIVAFVAYRHYTSKRNGVSSLRDNDAQATTVNVEVRPQLRGATQNPNSESSSTFQPNNDQQIRKGGNATSQTNRVAMKAPVLAMAPDVAQKRSMLIAFYGKYNPNQVGKVDDIMQAYTEEKIRQECLSRYHEDPFQSSLIRACAPLPEI